MILEVLRLQFPDIDKFIVSRDPNLIIEWPSQNPRVPEPLRLSTDGDPNLHWHLGYFYDFPIFFQNGKLEDCWLQNLAGDISDFLFAFFTEQIGCGLFIYDDKVGGGGPVWFEQQMFPDMEMTEYECWYTKPNTIVRSWRGNRDIR